MSGHKLTVAGDLSTENLGRLVMRNVADTVDVAGNVLFRGQSTDGLLTAGVMLVEGNFTQITTVTASSFAASGTHKVVLDGSSPQTVSFNHAAATWSHFQALEITDGVVNLATAVTVNGQLLSPAGSNPVIGGGSLTLAGANVQNLELDNTPVTLTTGTITAFDGVMFKNFPTDVTQLTVSRPSGTFMFDNLQFTTLSAGNTGFYVSAIDTNTADLDTLKIDLEGSIPSDGTTFTSTASGAIVSWAGATVGPATQLAFLVQPSSVTGGTANTTPLQVVAQDTETNTVTSFTGNVTLAIGSNPGGATLSGNLTVAALNGVATFSSVIVDKAASGYTLVAAATGLQPATSNVFEVTVGPPIAIVLESGNNQTGAVNTVLADSVSVRVVDAGGNGVSGINVSWTATAGGGLVRPALIPSDADGLAKAEWTLGPNPVVNTATATVTGLAGSPVTFTAGPP